MNKAIAILMVTAGLAFAQDGAEKVPVPLHDPSRPARVRVNSMFGGIRVVGGDVNNVLVETRPEPGGEVHESRPPQAEGMKRLDLPMSAGLDITEENNEVTIKTGFRNQPMSLVITVPRRSSLELKSMGGPVEVNQISGEIDASSMTGRVTLTNVSGSVVAHSMNGGVQVTFDRVDPSKPMSFSTMNGDIDVTFPADVKANVLLKADHGEIFSDFDVKLLPSNNPGGTESGRQPDGSYHLRLSRTLRGTIGGGGADFQFTSFNGQIYLRKKK